VKLISANRTLAKIMGPVSGIVRMELRREHVTVQMDTLVIYVRLNQTGARIRSLFNAEIMGAVMMGCAFVRTSDTIRILIVKNVFQGIWIAALQVATTLMERVSLTVAMKITVVDMEPVMEGRALVNLVGPEKHAKYDNVLETPLHACRPKQKISASTILRGSPTTCRRTGR
jgi:hypothetical protein